MTDDDLQSTARAIQERLEAEGVAVFPATIDCPDVDWPDDRNWAAFIDLALRVRTELFYFVTGTLTGDQLEAIIRHHAGPDREPGPELQLAAQEALAHVDKPCRIELAFANCHGAVNLSAGLRRDVSAGLRRDVSAVMRR
jgi:hypothetical protein